MKKILLVDDSRSARYFLKALLPAEAVEVEEASNGEEAIQLYREFHPDLVFMDLTMPVMDGFTAIPKLRDQDPEARVVVLTADVQKRTVERIEATGAVLFLKKPPRREAIEQALNTVFPNGL
jgi:two-component system chemotaxis response regulator CheY